MPSYNIKIEYQSKMGDAQAEIRLRQLTPLLRLKKIIYPRNFTAAPSAGGWPFWTGNLKIEGPKLQVLLLLDSYNVFDDGQCRITINGKQQKGVIECTGENPSTMHAAQDYLLI